MRMRPFLAIFSVVTICATSGAGQRMHTPKKSSSSPNVFDSVERTATDSQEPSSAELASRRLERRAKVAELNRELEGIISAASGLEERLKATDANNIVSLDLQKQGKHLEETARKIRKKISEL